MDGLPSFTELVDRDYQRTLLSAEEEAERARKERAALRVAEMDLLVIARQIDEDSISADETVERLGLIAERLGDWERI